MKKLFEVKTHINFDTYSKEIRKSNIYTYIVLFISFIILYYFLQRDYGISKQYIVIIYFIVLFILLVIILIIIDKLFLKNAYQRMLRTKNYALNYTAIFYDYYLEINNTGSFKKLYYKDIIRIAEKTDIIYLLSNNTPIIIKKDNSDLEFINFIRSFNNYKAKIKLSDKETNNNQSNNIGYKKTPPLIDHLPLITLLVTLYVYSIMCQINPKNPFANSWIMWCFLPLPIIGAIIENIYLKKGYRCKSNITTMFVITFIMTILGSLCLIFPN